jgi:hypothetical protein
VPSSYATMWGLLILMALGVGLELMSGGSLTGALRAAYPADLVKRDALHRCGQMDEQFSRFSANDRENCYKAILPASAHFSSTAVGG